MKTKDYTVKVIKAKKKETAQISYLTNMNILTAKSQRKGCWFADKSRSTEFAYRK